MKLRILIGILVCGWLAGIGFSQSPQSWTQHFDDLDSSVVVTELEGWAGFRGFPGETKPLVRVVEKAGFKGSKGLAITHGEPFRSDGWGLQIQLPQARESGAVWVQCKFNPPEQWAGGLFLDARGPERGAILARVSAALSENKATSEKNLRWHCTWSKSYWRLYTTSELDSDRWYTVTLRLDLDGRTCAAWVDDQPLAEEAQLAAAGPFSQLHLGFGGLGDSPAVVDDLVISSDPPKGFSAPDLLPKPEAGHIFRFAGLGDPQLGFGGYEADQIRFGVAVDQINRAGAEVSLILGDMVHDDKDEQAYRDLDALAQKLKQPTYVRGNHDQLDLYRKYFHEESDYSVVHKGVRFVVVDATGNQRGLSAGQLGWIESEFSTAAKAGEEIVLALHVSPWQGNKKGAGKYNQIGPGRDRLRELMKQYKVLLCLSGHYHAALWGKKEDETHYLVLGGTARVSGGTFGWCAFDVYPDRIVMHQKPLFFSYEKKGVNKVHALQDWIPYETLRKMHPYVQQGPLTIPRHRPAKN
ncbi:MAG: hypothetical protein HKN23_15325 [Verrucomicrobiales bacterium]|nr:hypothetical protein [Verrucomicrobiales bacterium]